MKIDELLTAQGCELNAHNNKIKSIYSASSFNRSFRLHSP